MLRVVGGPRGCLRTCIFWWFDQAIFVHNVGVRGYPLALGGMGGSLAKTIKNTVEFGAYSHVPLTPLGPLMTR